MATLPMVRTAISNTPAFRRLLLAAFILTSPVAAARAAHAQLGPQEATHRIEDLGDDAPSRSRVGVSGTRFGLGIILGRPTGLTGKLFLNGSHALQLHLGWGLESESFIVIFDYLFHATSLIPPVEPGRFIPYVGVGGRFGVRHDDALLGVRVPLGMAFLIRGAPVEIFLEIAVGIGLLPDTEGLVDGGLGGRFYF